MATPSSFPPSPVVYVLADFPNITLIVTFVKVLANDTQKLQPFLEKGALFWFFYNISFILSVFISGSCRPKFSFNQWMTGSSVESVAGRGTYTHLLVLDLQLGL